MHMYLHMHMYTRLKLLESSHTHKQESPELGQRNTNPKSKSGGDAQSGMMSRICKVLCSGTTPKHMKTNQTISINNLA